MKRSLSRLVSWVDAAAINVGLDPVKDAARVAEILYNRGLNRGTWWRDHVNPNMVKPPQAKVQQALLGVYLDRQVDQLK